jgi:hypothetical protein
LRHAKLLSKLLKEVVCRAASRFRLSQEGDLDREVCPKQIEDIAEMSWGNAMIRSVSAIVIELALGLLGFATASAQTTVVVAVPAQAGAVVGTTENSDAYVWRLFTEFAAPISKANSSPVVFETWASDEDTFSLAPHWPDSAAPKKLHASVLQTLKGPGGFGKAISHGTIDVGCNPPGNAAVGGFPTDGLPAPCIAEEVRRNRPQFDYIINNNLNTQAGLAAAFARSFKVEMPFAAIKGPNGQGQHGFSLE